MTHRDRGDELSNFADIIGWFYKEGVERLTLRPGHSLWFYSFFSIEHQGGISLPKERSVSSELQEKQVVSVNMEIRFSV